MCSLVQTLSFLIVKNELFGDKILIFDHYLLFNIVSKFVSHLKKSQSLLRNYKFIIQKLFKIAAPTTVHLHHNLNASNLNVQGDAMTPS